MIAHTLGPYHVVAKLGEGGMGEVYRARDTRLKRDVALKILPDSFATDAERLARFQREAEVLASLNHPHIAQIYGIEESNGVRALVMELVEGETLADRIAHGPIPVDEALPMAKQIAEALEAAHEQGIIHRDLKPANIKVRPDGTVKVLDFGLAKALEPTRAALVQTSQSPTITSPAMMTGIGVLLGTAAYMSPEQARGQAVDKRNDIWSFGCVLYEMLTGRRAFEGEDVSDTLANVLKREPHWETLPADVPVSVRTLLQACLAKNRQQRVANLSTVLFVINHREMLGSAPANRDGAIPRARRRGRAMVVAAAAVVVLALLGAYLQLSSNAGVPPMVSRFAIALDESDLFTSTGQRVVAVSRDGALIVYVANNRLYMRRLDRLESIPVRGVEGAPRNPFLSPDGDWVGFWQDGQIKKTSISGGAPVTICAASNIAGASWERDGTIVFSQGSTGIWRVSADGGTPENVVKLAEGQQARSPQMLPDGESILFSVIDGDNSRVVIKSLNGADLKTVINGGIEGHYLSTGHIVYVVGQTLLAVPFDLSSQTATGGPIPVVEEVALQGLSATTSPTGVAHFAISDEGTLVHVPATLGAARPRTLVWMDREGREESLKAPARAYQYPRISPDGTRVALDVRDEETDIWIWDFARETLTRATFGSTRDILPVWTPDSRRIVFRSERNSPGNLYWRAADGTGTEERLTESPNGQVAYAVSPDGALLVFRDDAGVKTATDLWLLRLADRRAEPLLRSTFNERHAELSRDGRWLAYASDESGRYEVYVRPFPNVDDGRWQVSSGGGTRPLWRPDGQELFFLSLSGALMSVRVQSSSTWTAGSPSTVLEGSYYLGGNGLPDRPYDVSPDGRRFLVIKNADSQDDTWNGPRILVTQHWFEELKRLVPAS